MKDYISTKQKRVHLQLAQSLPVKTHLKVWPEKRYGQNNMSPAEVRAAGRKGRLAARRSVGY